MHFLEFDMRCGKNICNSDRGIEACRFQYHIQVCFCFFQKEGTHLYDIFKLADFVLRFRLINNIFSKRGRARPTPYMILTTLKRKVTGHICDPLPYPRSQPQAPRGMNPTRGVRMVRGSPCHNRFDSHRVWRGQCQPPPHYHVHTRRLDGRPVVGSVVSAIGKGSCI